LRAAAIRQLMHGMQRGCDTATTQLHSAPRLPPRPCFAAEASLLLPRRGRGCAAWAHELSMASYERRCAGCLRPPRPPALLDAGRRSSSRAAPQLLQQCGQSSGVVAASARTAAATSRGRSMCQCGCGCAWCVVVVLGVGGVLVT
jgi:hypothetical protein